MSFVAVAGVAAGGAGVASGVSTGGGANLGKGVGAGANVDLKLQIPKPVNAIKARPARAPTTSRIFPREGSATGTYFPVEPATAASPLEDGLARISVFFAVAGSFGGVARNGADPFSGAGGAVCGLEISGSAGAVSIFS